jgi:serine/threonine-protein kinase RsbW
MSSVKLVLPSKTEKIEEAAYFVEKIARALNFRSGDIDNIAIATTEAVSNAILHGNKLDSRKKVRIEITADDEKMTICVFDEGKGFNPDEVDDPLLPENLLKERGRGIFILKKMMDHVEFSFSPSGTCVKMIKYRRTAQQEIHRDNDMQTP